MTAALVTGAAGFLGRHLVPALAAVYDTVDTLDLAAGSGDLRDVLPSLPRYDAVFHLAAAVGGRAGIEDEPLRVAGNLALDVAFFDYVARTRPAHAAYLSSSAVYPAPGGAPFREESVHPRAPRLGLPDGTYGWVKLTGEHLAAVVRERTGVPVVCYRPFSVYGPDQGGEYPVPAIAARALAREDPLMLWGSGRQTRDFVHVDDAIAAIVATHREDVESLNVCTGAGTDFLTLARLCADAVGYDPCITGDTSRPNGVGHRVGSPDLLARWFTASTTVEDGVRRVVSALA
jgi:GDP-L-fucose synthase